MNKVICDICGTSYPETSEQCPICGYTREIDVELMTEETAETETVEVDEIVETAAHTPVKGGGSPLPMLKSAIRARIIMRFVLWMRMLMIPGNTITARMRNPTPC